MNRYRRRERALRWYDWAAMIVAACCLGWTLIAALDAELIRMGF